MLALAVKGNRYQAERAAVNRGIPFAVQRESLHGETIGVAAWSILSWCALGTVKMPAVVMPPYRSVHCSAGRSCHKPC